MLYTILIHNGCLLHGCVRKYNFNTFNTKLVFDIMRLIFIVITVADIVITFMLLRKYFLKELCEFHKYLYNHVHKNKDIYMFIPLLLGSEI